MFPASRSGMEKHGTTPCPKIGDRWKKNEAEKLQSFNTEGKT